MLSPILLSEMKGVLSPILLIEMKGGLSPILLIEVWVVIGWFWSTLHETIHTCVVMRKYLYINRECKKRRRERGGGWVFCFFGLFFSSC